MTYEEREAKREEARRFIIDKYAGVYDTPHDFLLGAFEEAHSILGNGYVTEYYWIVAGPICQAYAQGRRDAIPRAEG